LCHNRDKPQPQDDQPAGHWLDTVVPRFLHALTNNPECATADQRHKA
jgi:hypothetical protein